MEFALLAVPFLLLLLGTFELALVFILGISLSNATAYEARLIRVGGLEAPGVNVTTSNGIQLDLTAVKTAICNQILLVPNATCMSQLQIDVRTVGSFGSASLASPVSGNTFSTANLCFYSGGAGSIVEMRSYYLWPLIDPLLLAPLANITTVQNASSTTTGSWSLISDTEVMKTESIPGLTPNTGASC